MADRAIGNGRSWGWHEIDGPTLHSIREKLKNFESMTWSDILVRSKKQHHSVAIENIAAELNRG